MSAYDWRDLTRSDRIVVQQVNPVDIDSTMGELEGVDLYGSAITAAYYTDTRASGKLRVVGEGWQRGTFLRIVHDIPEWGYTNELGTFLVTDDSRERENGVWVYDLTLQSLLFGLSTDKLVRPWVIAKNAMALKAAAQNLNAAAFSYDFTNANDARFKSAKVVETGTDRLSALFAIGEASGNRVDVDGHGRVTLERYVSPANKAPVFRIDLSDPRGVAVDGISGSTDYLETPDTVAVAYRYNTEQNGKSVSREINASATVSSDSPHSHARRGYTVTDFRELNEMAPATALRAQQLAKQYLANDSVEHVEWELETAYLPIWAGDTVTLELFDGQADYMGSRHCLVKNVDLDLGKMFMKLTLKETSGGDSE